MIVFDGVEFALDDPNLPAHLEAMRQQAEATRVRQQAEAEARAQQARAQAAAVRAGGQAAPTTDKPAEARSTADDGAKVFGLRLDAISPDGKLGATNDSATIRLWDAKNGTVLLLNGEPTQAKLWALASGGKVVTQARLWDIQQLDRSQAPADARVEALVKQAEALKPGSGDAVRRALQAAPKTQLQPPPTAKPGQPKRAQVEKDPAPGWPWSLDAVKGVIEIRTEDGKVKELQLDLNTWKKLLETPNLGIPLRLESAPATPTAASLLESLSKAIMSKDEPAAKKALEQSRQQQDKATDQTAAPTQPPPQRDLEALSRQVERLNAELNKLRQELRDRAGKQKN